MKAAWLLVVFSLLPASARAITMEEARTAQVEIRAIVPYFNTRTGWALDPEKVFVYDSVMPLAGGLAGEPSRIEEDARGILATSNAAGKDSFGTWYDDPAGEYCLILLSGRGLAQAGPLRSSLFAHELFHCYQHAASAPVGLGSVAKWITEGQAEWAGETYANDRVRSSAWFDTFLASGFMSLYERDYDAMPFYAHAFFRLGTTLWPRLLRMVRTGVDAESFEQAFYSPAEDENLQTWPMSIWRDETKGRDWTIVLPGGGSSAQEFPRETLRAGDIREFDAATVQHFTLNLRDNKMYRVRLTGAYGGLSAELLTGGAIDERLSPGSTAAFCFSSDFDCRCPNGGPPIDEFRQLGRDRIDIAVTAGPRGPGRIEIVESDPTCCGGAEGSVDPGLVGTWELVPNDYANVVFASPSGCVATGRGNHTMIIRSNGGVLRTTSLTSEQRCETGSFSRITSEHVLGSSVMCMRSTAGPGEALAFYTVQSDTHMTDFINSMGAVSQPYNSEGPREPPSLAPYVGSWIGANRELRGSYLLDGDVLVIRSAATSMPGARGARRYTRVSH